MLAILWTLTQTTASHPHWVTLTSLPLSPPLPSIPFFLPPSLHPSLLNISLSQLHAPSFRLQCLLTLRRLCVQTEGRAMKDLWMWCLWASLHPLPPPPPPSPPHPAPIIISNLLSAWSPPHQVLLPNPRVPAACTPSSMTSNSSPPPPLPLPPPPPPPPHCLLRPYQPGRTHRRKPQRIRKYPSLSTQGWLAVMTSWQRTVVLAVTAVTQDNRRARVHVWGSWRDSTVLTRKARASSCPAPVLTPG